MQRYTFSRNITQKDIENTPVLMFFNRMESQLSYTLTKKKTRTFEHR